MDERSIDHDPQAEARDPERAAPAAPRQATPAPAVVLPPSTGKEAWRSGSGCGLRMRLYLFGLAAVILIVVLFAGLSVLRRGVWVTFEQGRRAVVQNLPPELPPAERQRTVANLDRFRSLLDRVDDPYPLMGEFMTRVRAVLEDGRLTVDEVGGLNVSIERAIEEAGVTPMQLGIRSSEFGIRNAAPPPPMTGRDSVLEHPPEVSVRCFAPERMCRFARGGVVGNSELRIPNSEFA